MALFRDRTGRPGPSTWELGSFPEGQAELSGVGRELVRGRGLRGVRREEPADAPPLVPRGRPLALLGDPARTATSAARARDRWGSSRQPHHLRQLRHGGQRARVGLERGRGSPLHARRGLERPDLSLHGARRPRSDGPQPDPGPALRPLRDAAPGGRVRRESRTSVRDLSKARPVDDGVVPHLPADSSTTTPSISPPRWRRWTTVPPTGARRRSASPRPTAANASPRGCSCRRTPRRRSRPSSTSRRRSAARPALDRPRGRPRLRLPGPERTRGAVPGLPADLRATPAGCPSGPNLRREVITPAHARTSAAPSTTWRPGPTSTATRIAFYGLSMGAYVGPLVGAVEPRLRTLVLVAAGSRRAACRPRWTRSTSRRASAPPC